MYVEAVVGSKDPTPPTVDPTPRTVDPTPRNRRPDATHRRPDATDGFSRAVRCTPGPLNPSDGQFADKDDHQAFFLL